jgi:ketosteroid isomerase-like protein
MTASDTLELVNRLVAATNAHDIEALVDCFAPDYVNQTPAHPQRGFTGRDHVRRNWTAIFAGMPDIASRLVACVVDGSTVWTEWEMHGTLRDGQPQAMAGVVVFGVRDGRLASARFYIETVELTSGDADAAAKRTIQPGTS